MNQSCYTNPHAGPLPAWVPVPALPFSFLGQDVDEAHYAYSFKYLKNKPVKELRDDQFLKTFLAEEEGFLTIDISIDMKGVEG